MDRIREIVEAGIRDGVIRGAAVAAGSPDGLLLKAGYGEAAPGVPMTPGTIVDVASLTKVAATTTALLICRDRGLVDFDAPFTRYLPDFEPELPEPVTVRQLAMHVSGFTHDGHEVRQYFSESGAEIMRNILRFPPEKPAGKCVEYMCWNFLLLGLVVERVTGERLDSFCAREIFKPLGMSDTSLGKPVSREREKLAQTVGTEHPGEISDFIAFRVYRDGLCAGNAGLFSTARDLIKFGSCILRRGKGLFSEESFREMTVPRTPAGVLPERSFGWIVRDGFTPPAASAGTVFHSGWSGQTLLCDWEKGRSAVVLTTRFGDYDRAKRDRFAIAELLLEQFN